MGARGSQQVSNKNDSQNTEPFINTSSSLDKNESHSNDNHQLSNPRSEITSPLRMPISNTYTCNQCGMVFPSDEALFKHRTRFCIGAMDSNIGKRLYYSDDEDIDQLTPRNTKQQSPIEKKREEIHEWKNQRFVRQNVQDMEDRIVRDSQKTQRLANNLKKRTHDYNQILKEYEQLQTHERDLLRQMFDLHGQSGSKLNQSNVLNDYQRNQLEILQRQTSRLDQERRIIQNKLEDLIENNSPSSSTSNYEPYRLLHDMKEEQDQNEKTLLYLRRRIAYPKSTLSLPYINTPGRTSADEVRTLRNGYLHSGGYDTNILTRYSDLEQRLRNYEYYPWLRDYPEPLRLYRYRPIETPTNKLILAQNENQRLQNELENIERKFQRLDSRTRQLELTVATSGVFDHKSNGYHSYSSPKIDHYPQLRSFNDTSTRPIYTNYDDDIFDQHRSYQQISLPSLDKRTTSHVTQPMNYVNSNLSKLRDPLGPQPYDPVAGFVMFFDFITNLPSTIDQCRLITCLHYPDSGLGEPSQLQPFKCELYTNETNGEQMNFALIATKQPVPRCSPLETLSVVIEIQVTTKQTANEILRTNAWVKLPLFDHRNRLLSGRWKVPLKTLPIQQNENLRMINTLPSYGSAELHYRLVNSRDAPDQANVQLSPAHIDLYFYPQQYRNGTYM